jgi:manganese efflux pump family protein
LDLLIIFLTAIGLSFDTFAVSVSSGIVKNEITFFNAMKIAFSLAFFQSMMPLAGWAIGIKIKEFVSSVDHWIAFGLLSIIGLKMILESLKKEKENTFFNPLNFLFLIGMSVATSIDAFVVGVSFGFVNMSIFVPLLIIGAVTFIVSMLGILFGKKAGAHFGKKMEILGGIILIGIGTKILIQHLFLS